jgi:hypothetical protein
MNTAIEIAPARLSRSLLNLCIIYGVSIFSCYVVNIYVRAFPIGPWTGQQIGTMYWLDNVTLQLMSLWWALLSIVSGGWPFDGISNVTARGVTIIAASWIAGWLSAKGLYWSGLGASWVFPIIGCLYFFIALFSFAGENWIVAGMAPARQFFILFVLIAFLTYAVTSSSIRWIPAWWFPFICMGSGSQLLSYLTRGMRQPGRGIVQIAILFLTVLVALWISARVGLWDGSKPGIGAFWLIGTYTSSYWLLWFMVGCSIGYGVLMQLYNWPFTKLRMPYGGLLACSIMILLTSLITADIYRLVGSVFTDVNEALTYGYMGVHWSFVLTLLFGLGLERPYLWVGQKTPGVWNDVT